LELIHAELALIKNELIEWLRLKQLGCQCVENPNQQDEDLLFTIQDDDFDNFPDVHDFVDFEDYPEEPIIKLHTSSTISEPIEENAQKLR